MTAHPSSVRRRTGLRMRIATVAAIGAAFALTATGPAAAQPAPQAPVAATCQSFWPTPYQVCGEILDLYKSLGGPSSSLSYPSSSEVPAGDGIGTRQSFFGGTVYYSPTTGAFVE